jgi:uncharacterized protein (PEP-CTERM system associated)
MRAEHLPLLVAVVAAGLGARTASAETWQIVPSIGLQETWSDNAALLPGDRGGHGWITNVYPGLRIQETGARTNVFLDYRLSNVAYSSASRLDSTQQYLNAFATVQAIERLLYVDARATISQQTLSPFGTAIAPGGTSASTNRVETKAFQVSPYIRGHIGDIALYNLRFNGTDLRADEIVLPETKSTEWVGSIRNATPSAKLGWAVDGNALTIRNDAVGSLDDARVRGALIYSPDPQLQLSAIEGFEDTDFASANMTKRCSTPGAGLNWVPSERTQLAGLYQKRFFGDGHSFTFTHRTPGTAWRFVSGKDVVVLPTLLAARSTGSVQALMYDLLTSAIPDPVARAEAVRKRIEDSGIPESSVLGGTSLTARPFIQNNQEASFALVGVNNTMTFTIARREHRGIGPSLAGTSLLLADDFYRQRAAEANWAHKLSPFTTLTLVANTLRTEGITVSAPETKQTSVSLLLSTRLGPRTSMSLGLRHVDFDSTVPFADYRENAVVATFLFKM